MRYRGGELSCGLPRSGRYYQIAGQWYFSTREKLQVGPFQSLDDAEVELGLTHTS